MSMTPDAPGRLCWKGILGSDIDGPVRSNRKPSPDVGVGCTTQNFQRPFAVSSQEKVWGLGYLGMTIGDFEILTLSG
jgi:hypothetical protein